MAKVNHSNVKVTYLGKQIRKEKGLNLKEVEAATRIAISTLSKWENNKAIPSLDALVLISEYYKVPWTSLVTTEIIK